MMQTSQKLKLRRVAAVTGMNIKKMLQPLPTTRLMVLLHQDAIAVADVRESHDGKYQ